LEDRTYFGVEIFKFRLEIKLYAERIPVYQSAGVGSMNPNTSESNIPDRQYKTFA
jgi:hypothetical protein